MITNSSVSSSAPNLAESAKAAKEKAEDRPHHPWVTLRQLVDRQHHKDDAEDRNSVPYRIWHAPPYRVIIGEADTKGLWGQAYPRGTGVQAYRFTSTCQELSHGTARSEWSPP